VASETVRTFFYVLTFFIKIQKHDFLRFFGVAAHVSRTLIHATDIQGLQVGNFYVDFRLLFGHDTVRYLLCAQKLTLSQFSLAQGSKKHEQNV